MLGEEATELLKEDHHTHLIRLQTRMGIPPTTVMLPKWKRIQKFHEEVGVGRVEATDMDEISIVEGSPHPVQERDP